jgi:hypothetical protein
MAGNDSDAPASAWPSPTKIPPSAAAVTEVGCVALPPAPAARAVEQPEADFLKLLNAEAGPSGRGECASNIAPNIPASEQATPTSAFCTRYRNWII